jgi:hypothetical protein
MSEQQPVPPEEFTWERVELDGSTTPVEFTTEEEQQMADAMAKMFGDMGITGVRWVDTGAEDDVNPT